MLKSLICFIGLYSCACAAINICPILDNRKVMLEKPTCVVISATDETFNQFADHMSKTQQQLNDHEILITLGSGFGSHLYIGLDGHTTCFVPGDYARAANVIKDYDYDELAAYLMNNPYVTTRCCAGSGWGRQDECDNFSINITLECKKALDLYTDEQIDTVYKILKALKKQGIESRNIVGYAEVSLGREDLFLNKSDPDTPFWRKFYERHDGFFCVPKVSTTYKIKDAKELEDALLKIGYTNPRALPAEQNHWLCQAVNAFILRYLPEEVFRFRYPPEEVFRFSGLDRDVLTAKVAYDEGSSAFDQSLSKFLWDNKEILDNITKYRKCSADNLDELSDALVELGYKKEEGEREREMIARAVNNVSQHLFGYPDYHQHTFIYPPEGTCYSKELTYNILRDRYPEILSAIEQIANI